MVRAPITRCLFTSKNPIKGIMYMAIPFVFAALQQWPSFKSKCSAVGLTIISSAMILSSFSKSVWHLILTQGVLYAIGGTMLYTPTILFLDEWFVRRKGFAFGVMMVCRFYQLRITEGGS